MKYLPQKKKCRKGQKRGFRSKKVTLLLIDKIAVHYATYKFGL